MSKATGILLLSPSDTARRQWAEMLTSTMAHVWSDPAQVSPDEQVDVIVTDRPLAPDVLQQEHERLARGEIGVIAAGSGGPADVALPAGFTRRELHLACMLLAEIVRLRRERRREERARKVLSQLALSDPLTGLFNRRAWNEELKARAPALSTGRDTLCVALVDLDHFKRVNDELGHMVGDEVLRAVGKALNSGLRGHDFVARLGGDEFALLLPDVPPQEAFHVVEQVRRRVCERFQSGDLPRLTASAGFAVHDGAGSAIAEQLFVGADGALRRAKAQGRNQTVAAP